MLVMFIQFFIMNHCYSLISVDPLIHPEIIFVCPNSDFFLILLIYFVVIYDVSCCWKFLNNCVSMFFKSSLIIFDNLLLNLLIFLLPLILAAVFRDIFQSLLIFVPVLLYSLLILVFTVAPKCLHFFAACSFLFSLSYPVCKFLSKATLEIIWWCSVFAFSWRGCNILTNCVQVGQGTHRGIICWL